jgi:AcrR family transcriptional regulator
MKEDARDRILEAALRVLEQHGSRGFRQARIAEEAGLRQSHLTYYFPTRSALAEALVARLVESQRAALQKAVAGASEERLVDRLLDALKAGVTDARRTRLLLALFLEVEEEAAGVARKLRETQRTQRKALARLLGRGEDDSNVALALAALRGIAIDQLVAPRSRDEIDALFVALGRLLDVGTVLRAGD